MQQYLDDLVAQAERKGGGRFDKSLRLLEQLASESENRPALLAHARFVPLLVELIAQGRQRSIGIIGSLAKDDASLRDLFLRPGLVQALVHALRATDKRYTTLGIMTRLLTRFENKIDFVGVGYAAQVGQIVLRASRDYVMDLAMCEMLLACVDRVTNAEEEAGEEADYRMLREEFFYAPGVMAAVLSYTGLSVNILRALSECERIAQQMLAFPGLVKVIVDCVIASNDRNAWGEVAYETLLRLVDNSPVRALEHPQLIPSSWKQ